MSEVQFPIDIIGIDGDSRISKIVANAQPGTSAIWPLPQVGAVLEVPGGFSRKAQWKLGDQVDVDEVVEKTAALSNEDAQILHDYLLEKLDAAGFVEAPSPFAPEYYRIFLRPNPIQRDQPFARVTIEFGKGGVKSFAPYIVRFIQLVDDDFGQRSVKSTHINLQRARTLENTMRAIDMHLEELLQYLNGGQKQAALSFEDKSILLDFLLEALDKRGFTERAGASHRRRIFDLSKGKVSVVVHLLTNDMSIESWIVHAYHSRMQYPFHSEVDIDEYGEGREGLIRAMKEMPSWIDNAISKAFPQKRKSQLERAHEIPQEQLESSSFDDDAKDKYFHDLWPEELADSALDPQIDKPVMRHAHLLLAPGMTFLVMRHGDSPKNFSPGDRLTVTELFDVNGHAYVKILNLSTSGSADMDQGLAHFSIPVRYVQKEVSTNGWLPVRLITSRTHHAAVCPHCNEEMEKGSTFGGKGRTLHRPCVKHGPIEHATKTAIDQNDNRRRLDEMISQIKDEILRNVDRTTPIHEINAQIQKSTRDKFQMFRQVNGDDAYLRFFVECGLLSSSDSLQQAEKVLIDMVRSKLFKRHARTAQIVDEAKFVDKVSNILTTHAGALEWTPDVLNGGSSERAVVTRRELSRWLAAGQAAPESTQYIIDAAATDRGLSLIGDAFILAGQADMARVGFTSTGPMLVLYRQAQS